jgi:2-oxoglutarate ferredoxin oxidoreductase subunit alpha
MDYMRIRGFPFDVKVEKFIDSHERVFVVEQNRDAQLKSLLTLELNVSKRKLISIRHYDGSPITPDHVLDGINEVGDVLEEGSAA